MKRKIAVLGALLENPTECQEQFNNTVAKYNGIINGRMGIPYDNDNMSVISMVMVGTLDEINNFTNELGDVNGVTVKTSISQKEI